MPRLIVYRRDDTWVYRPSDTASPRVQMFWKRYLAYEETDDARFEWHRRHLRDAILPCKPLVYMFEHNIFRSLRERLAIYVDTIPRAVRQCGCDQKVDIELFENLMMLRVNAHKRRQYSIPLTSDPSAPTKIHLGKGDTVGHFVEAYDQLDESQRNGKLWLKLR